VLVRRPEAGKVGHVRQLPNRRRFFERPMEGGRTRHKAGYVMIWSSGHPRAGKSQYVFEHILVMERLLGRYMLPEESVHHRNGVKDDNGPENLELWTRPQPAGIRVSDAVAWAREILARYPEYTDTSNNAQGLR
jgi:hypothetical protein